ncbi:hypothetical protein [Mycoplasma suis]|uniref:Uncharacterized protein n=2 Tax=Mycoplasma suis TaxID=57372 RepID=F0QQV1_MYCSL|nr:hypothetical protein [Mycoplasma suis]ADX97871.1 hypothetical protein MSU_0329 [Mycoplasma suis str. Illinois]CBZ40371.1 hypothetical protein MSUIS_02780 [Mycoplasma suis KI3806]
MLVKSLIALIASAGVAVPVSSAIKDSFHSKSHSVLKNSESIVTLEWTSGGLQEEVGQLINGIGKVIRGGNVNQSMGEIIGLELQTSGAFNKEICKDLGFTKENEESSSLGCEQIKKD